jgi:DNA-binding MarR family transcriptional regulator
VPLQEGEVSTENLEIEFQIVESIRRIIRAVDQHSRQLLDTSGLTAPQIAALDASRRHGPLTIGSLAKSLRLSHPTVTGIVGRLEKRGYLVRERGTEDRRTILVRITDLGADVLERAPRLLQDRFRREIVALEPWERHQILSTLQRIAGMMDAEELGAVPHLVSGVTDISVAEGGENDAADPHPEPPAKGS